MDRAVFWQPRLGQLMEGEEKPYGTASVMYQES